jgi:hypothetical protein
MMILLMLGFAACQSVHSDKLTAADLAQAVPEFAALPPETPLGYAPRPGANRNLTARDIQNLARQAGISTNFQDTVCLEWRMRKLERAELLDVMRTTLQQPDADVKILEFSLFPVPEGRLEFPMAGLSIPVNGPAFWRGYVTYGNGKHFDVWAKVVLADSANGKPLIDVRSGETVHVVVENGAAQLKLDARAESSGLVGQKITVRNPRSGKTFPAEVTGRSYVRVIAGEPAKGEMEP